MMSRTRIVPPSTSAFSSAAIAPEKSALSLGNSTTRVLERVQFFHHIVVHTLVPPCSVVATPATSV